MTRRRVVALLTLALAAGCSAVGIRSGTEEPAYEVLAALDDAVEIRRYGPLLAAETVVPPGPDARNQAFRRLAGYIFGDNHGSQKVAMTVPVTLAPAETIAMTAPVTVANEATGLRMRFFLPAELTLATAPLPNDAMVVLVELPAQTLAARRFSGSTGAEAIARETAALLQTLASSDWQPAGDPVAYLYDPPWTLPPLRRNEVVVPVVRAGG